MEGRLEGLRILVVDDYMDQQVLLACILEQYGASVITAGSDGSGGRIWQSSPWHSICVPPPPGAAPPIGSVGSIAPMIGAGGGVRGAPGGVETAASGGYA